MSKEGTNNKMKYYEQPLSYTLLNTSLTIGLCHHLLKTHYLLIGYILV